MKFYLRNYSKRNHKISPFYDFWTLVSFPRFFFPMNLKMGPYVLIRDLTDFIVDLYMYDHNYPFLEYHDNTTDNYSTVSNWFKPDQSNRIAKVPYLYNVTGIYIYNQVDDVLIGISEDFLDRALPWNVVFRNFFSSPKVTDLVSGAADGLDEIYLYPAGMIPTALHNASSVIYFTTRC